MTADFKALLKQAKLPERSVPVCLRGDLTADHEAAERELDQAQRRPVDSLAGSGTGDLADRIEALQDQMQEHTYPFRMRALPRPDFRALIDAHPPRRDDDNNPVAEDANLGVDRSTFFDALIRACTVDPVLTPDEWRELFGDNDEEKARREREDLPVEEGKLTDRQHGDLADAAWFLNRGEVDVPFSHAVSRLRRITADE